MGTKNLTAAAAIILTTALTVPVSAQPTLNNSTQVASLTNIRSDPPNTGGARVFAQELFGDNSESLELAMGSVIVLQYPAGTETLVSNEQTAVLTFQFNGAVLADPITGGSLVFRATGGTAQTTMTFSAGRDGGGGQVGDNFVSYTLTMTANDDLAANEFAFTVPNLMGASVADGEEITDRIVTVSVTLEPPPAGRFGSAGDLFPQFPPADATGEGYEPRVIAVINPAYTVTVDPAATDAAGEPVTTPNLAEIELDDPTMFTATSSPIQVSGLGDDSMAGLKISTATVTAASGDQKTLDGVTDFTLGMTDMLRAIVTGNFAASDRLFLSTTTTGNVTYSETNDIPLTISADGTSAEGAGPISVGTDMALYYVPGGGDIQRGLIGSTYTIDLAAATGRDSSMSAQDLTLEYSGIGFTNYAYAIPGPNAADAGNLRVRCEGASDCVVFFRCMDQRGRDVGGFERTSISAGVVRYMSSTNLATMLGVSDWSGRMSCSLHSSSRVSVQLLVRSGGTLTNNTFIGGLDASR